MIADLSTLPVIAQMREIRSLARLSGRGTITIAASRAGFALSRVGATGDGYDGFFLRGIDIAIIPHISDRFMKWRAIARLQQAVVALGEP